jgi:hypothetical protein
LDRSLAEQVTEAALSVIKGSFVTAILRKKYNKNTGKSQYALLSKSNPDKVLKWFGVQKPSDKAVKEQERRVQFWKRH